MKGMSPIVKTVTRWVKVFIFIFGMYITLTGHLTPGGGFAGGVIIAALYILLTLAFGKTASLKRFPKGLASVLDSVGASLFLLIGLLAFAFGSNFFANYLIQHFPGQSFNLLSAGTIPISNIAIGIKVASSLFIVFFIMSVLRIEDTKNNTKKFIQEEEEE